MWLTAFFFVLGAIPMFVLAGGKDEYNKTIREAWDKADRKFTNFIRKLKDDRAVNVADQLASIFGFVSITAFVALFLLAVLGKQEIFIFLLFLYSFSVWMGVKWYTKGEGKKLLKDMLLLPLAFLLLPIMDVLSGTNMAYFILEPIDPLIQVMFGFSPSGMSNVLLIALFQVGFVAFMVAFMFLALSIMLFPIMLSAVAVGLSSIWLARALHSISIERPMRPFMVLLGVLSLAYFCFK